MWMKRDIIRATAAITTGLAILGLFRFFIYDYTPPQVLIHDLERSAIVNAGMRWLAMMGYGLVTLLMMAVFFKVVQERWPGHASLKGMAFGTSLGVVWSFGFLAGWAFLGSPLRVELMNSITDLIALSFAGWLMGLALGRDVADALQRMWKPWLAVILVACGFVAIHTLVVMRLAEHFPSTAILLLVPTTLTQMALLCGLGLWAGVMFMVLRASLPCKNSYARMALFAFGVFGHSWILFHLFFVIEFAGVLYTVLLVGLTGALGVFTGALAYETLNDLTQRKN